MALPSTPMLDDFSRPDESPLSYQGRWALLDTAYSANQLQIINRVCTRVGAAESGSYWVPSVGLDASEAWAVAKTDLTGGSFELILRANGVGGSSTFDGYAGILTSGTATIGRFDDTVFTSLDAVASDGATTNDVILFRAVGTELTLYRIRNNTPALMLRASDATYPTGALAIRVDPTVSVGPFGGGLINSLSAPPMMRAGASTRW